MKEDITDPTVKGYNDILKAQANNINNEVLADRDYSNQVAIVMAKVDNNSGYYNE